MSGHTVVAVFEKIVSVIIVILLSCLDLFAGDVLLQVSNQTSDQHLALWCPLCVFEQYLFKLTGSSLASLLTMLSR